VVRAGFAHAGVIISVSVSEESGTTRPRNRRLMLVAAIALAVVALVGVAGVSTTPLLCGSCHTVAPSYEGWQASAHSDVWCIQCHADFGPAGWAGAILNGADELVRYAVDAPANHELAATVPSERCVRCHADAWADEAFAASHPTVDARCGACHREAYHTNERNVYPEMGIAARDVVYGDSVTCAECHTTRQMLRADIMAHPCEIVETSVQGSGEG